jgi:hypothetical protein
MAEVGTIGKLHGEILSSARCPHVRAKGVSHKTKLTGWASTLSADRMRPLRWSDDSARHEVRAMKARVLKTEHVRSARISVHCAERSG